MSETNNSSSARRMIVDIAHETARFGLVLLILSLLLIRLDRGVLALEVTAMILILGPHIAILIYSHKKSERHSAMRILGLVVLLLVIAAIMWYL